MTRKTATRILSFCLLMLIAVPIPGFAQKRTFEGTPQVQSPQNPRLGFVIHGGAGVIPKGSLSPEREAEYKRKLEEAVIAGYRVLQSGRSALDAVEIALRILEDSPLFNAGKGAVFTADGTNELDASIMDGRNLGAGAVAGLKRVKNPISLARAVMEKSPHVMLIGEGAEKFALTQSIEMVEPSYFFTQPRWDSLQRIKREEGSAKPSSEFGNLPENKFGTVGAVALDREGNLAAGTSTGGMTNKKWGRVGDAPIIGAGTYANNESCAVSATGWGEYFIRLGVAKEICTLVEYRALPVQHAADIVIMKKLQNLGGDGGVIVLDKFGNIGISFNSEGMYRAYIGVDGKPVVEIYKD